MSSIMKCVSDMLGEIPNVTPKKDKEGLSIEHAAWMLMQVKGANPLDVEKANRWLGYVAALFILHEVCSLDHIRGIMRKHFK